MIPHAFILGNPRSGTSLFRLILNSHPNIISPPESGFLQWWYPQYQNWSAADGRSESTIRAYVKDLLSSRKIETWQLDEEALVQYLLAQAPQHYGELSAWVYRFYGRHKEAAVIIDKNNYYIHHLETLREIWPEARWLFLVRDGRDVACSYLALQNLDSKSPYRPKLPSEIAAIADEWADNNLRVYGFLKTLAPGQVWQLRYEELVQDTQGTLEPICDWLGIPFSPNMLAHEQHHDEPASTLDWKRKTLQRPDAHDLGKYKRLLSTEQIATFNQRAESALRLFGYLDQV